MGCANEPGLFRAECTTISDVTTKLEDLSLLSKLLAATGLDKEASDVNAEITVFAPSNAAITKFASGIKSGGSPVEVLSEDTDSLKKVCALWLL